MPATPGDAGFSVSQLKYASIIVGRGMLRNENKDDIVTALMVALAESNLQNYANSNVPESLGIGHDAVGSDHKSVGLFQQQVGIWGSAKELMTPATSADKFYDALKNAPKGQPWIRAQAVQKSAFPDGSNYRAKYDDAVKAMHAINPDYVSPSPGDDAWTRDGKTIGPNSGGAAAWAEGLAALGKTLQDPAFWSRAGLFALGAALVLVALWQFTGAGKYLSAAAGTAAKIYTKGAL